MNSYRTTSGRAIVMCVGSAALLAFTAACGEDPTLDASNRGSGSHTEDTSVEDAYIVPLFVPGACSLQVGNRADLRFTVTNNRATETERLREITTDAVDTVRMTPSTLVIEPHERMAVGEPVAQPTPAPGGPKSVNLEGLDIDARSGDERRRHLRLRKGRPHSDECPHRSVPRTAAVIAMHLSGPREGVRRFEEHGVDERLG